MPIAIELERLTALIGQLIPLTKAERGDLIRAEHWNVVVGALIELARAVSAVEADTHVPEHEHTGDVALDWLDPKLRQLIERGPLDDPVAATRIQLLEQRAKQLGRTIDDVGASLHGLRERLDETVTRDQLRERSIVRLTQKVDGIDDARHDVVALRQTLGAISASVEGAVALRHELEVDGQLVDVRLITGQLRSLQDLSRRLVMPNGQILDATTFEQRLRETENRFVPREELDEILERPRRPLSPEQLSGITADLRVQLGRDIDDVRKQFEDRLGTELNARFSDIDRLVANAVAGSVPSVRDALAESLRADLVAVVKERADRLVLDLDARLNELDGRVKGALDREITALRTSVARDVAAVKRDVVPRPEISVMLNDRIAPVEVSVQKVASERAAADDQIFANLRDLGAKGSNTDATLRRLNDGLDARIASQIDAKVPPLVDSTVNTRLGEAETRLHVVVQDEVRRRVAEIGPRPFPDPLPPRPNPPGPIIPVPPLAGPPEGGQVAPVPTAAGDDLTRIPGVGPALAARLARRGLSTFASLGAASPADVADVLKKSESGAADIVHEARRLSEA